MKYIVLLCDGMSDLPCDGLGGKTPMAVANKPNMDSLAKVSYVGTAKTVPETLPPGSDVANLSVLGYDPSKYYTGRSPFEAASIGIALDDTDVAVRCNLVTLSNEENFLDAEMLSYCADDISTVEADKVIQKANAEFANDIFKFYTGVAYRHCLVWKNGLSGLGMVPPHDITGLRIGDYIKYTPENKILLDMMEKSYRVLGGGLCLWLWGEGKKAALPPFKEKMGLSGAIISAVDLLKGIGKIAHMDVLEVPGATGYIDTDFSGKTDAAVKVLRGGVDFVYIHIEAPDECGHRGEVENKVRSIELIDELVLGKILKEFEGEPIRILICPDHPTPLKTMTHSRDPVPFLIYDSTKPEKGVGVFCEDSAESTGNYIQKGYELVEKLCGI